MDYLNFAVEHPIVAAIALIGVTLSICLILEQVAGVIEAARTGGKK